MEIYIYSTLSNAYTYKTVHNYKHWARTSLKISRIKSVVLPLQPLTKAESLQKNPYISTYCAWLTLICWRDYIAALLYYCTDMFCTTVGGLAQL